MKIYSVQNTWKDKYNDGFMLSVLPVIDIMYIIEDLSPYASRDPFWQVTLGWLFWTVTFEIGG